MRTEGTELARDALTMTLAAALRDHSRQSAHPADQRALRHAAARIASALEAEFLVIARHSSSAELTERRQLSEVT